MILCVCHTALEELTSTVMGINIIEQDLLTDSIFLHQHNANILLQYDRVSTFLDSLWRSFESGRAQNYVIVAHGVSIRVFLARYFRYSIDRKFCSCCCCLVVIIGTRRRRTHLHSTPFLFMHGII